MEEEQNLWSLGNNGSGFSGEFNPSSLDGFNEGVGSLGSLNVREEDDSMDLGDDDIAVPDFSSLPKLPPRTSVFPNHPGPTVPLKASQLFDQLLTPNMSVSQATMNLLNKIFQFQTAQRANLDKLRLAQLQILSRPSSQALMALAQQESKMKNDTNEALQGLIYIWCGCLLSPMEIHRWDFLWTDLQVQLLQIRLFLEELQAYSGKTVHENPSNCAIALISQPFPMVATRGRAVEGRPMVVQLLTGATVDVLNVSHVRAEAVIPKGTKGKVASDLMEKHSSPLQPTTMHAEFRLKFANGTRKQPVNFQFQVQVQVSMVTGPPQQFAVSSPLTPPTISVTNEVQWEEAEGILIEKMAFQSETISWYCLANHLQRHIIDATRQSVTNLTRIFSLVELSYFHKTFFGGGNQVNVNSFREWWKWYGKAIHKIRYTKHILSLYLNGHMFGFIGKSDMEKSLLGRPPGTFMIRFSERNAGSFSIAYVTQDPANPMSNMVRHYLVSQEDTSQRRSLADFIGESPALTHFLKYDTKSGFNLGSTPLGTRVNFDLQEKHEALAEYYAKREAIQHTSGYDSQLNPQPPLHVFRQNLGMAGMDGQGSLSLSDYAAGSISPTLSFKHEHFEDDYWNAE